MRKRLLCLLLALVLTLSLLPAQVLAYVGAIDAPMTEHAVPVVTKLEGSNQGSQIWSMKVADSSGKASGDGLEFYLAINGPHAGKSVTSSARYHKNAYMMDSIGLGVYEQARFTLQTGNTQKELKLESMEVIDPKTEPGFDTCFGYEVPSEGALTVRCTFSGLNAGDPEILCFISYHIVKLGNGITNGSISERVLNSKDGSRTYAVVARAAWASGSALDNHPDFVLRFFQDYHGFSRMGHARGDANSAHVLLSRNYDELVDNEIIFTATSTDITAGLGRTKVSTVRSCSGEISEIYTDSYGVDNPFVLTDYMAVWETNQGIKPPLYISYDAKTDCLSTETATATVTNNNYGEPYVRAMHVWGFRDVYGSGEGDVEDPKFTAPDTVTIPQDASKLALYASDDGVVAAALTDDTIAAKFKALYGEPLYTLRGNFEARSDGKGKYYEFTDRQVALTSTITATWPASDHFYVRVDENGLLTSFDTTAMVQYSTPTFKLYWAKDDKVPAPKLVVKDDVLTLTDINPEMNTVLVFIDIPEVTTSIDTVQLKPDGDIILSGNMGLSVIFNNDGANVDLNALGYGAVENKDGSIGFEENGIEASGHINTGDLMGLELADINADINTFGKEESYRFDLELNAFDLFEAAAELELKRLNNGRLAPNDLYFRLATAGGIPIVPPVPTTFIKGGGGGFYGLADTINGDFIAIPPIRLKLSVKGDYIKVIEGWANVTVGPSYLEFSGTDMTIAKMDFIEEFKLYLRLTGEKRDYLGKTYTGLRAGGGIGLTLNAPGGDKAIFEVEGEAEASIFGGLDNYSNPTSAYVNIDSRGTIGAKVKIPKQLGRIRFRLLGGKVLKSTTVDFILGAQTAIPVGSNAGSNAAEVLKNVTTKAWDNLSIYGGVSNMGSFGTAHYRIFYIIPNHFGGDFSLWRNVNRGWSLEGEIEKYDPWNPSGKARTLSAESAWGEETYLCIDDETGEQIGIAVVESNLNVLPMAEDEGISLYAMESNGQYVENINFSTDDTNAPDSDLGLIVTVDVESKLKDLRDSIAVYADDSTTEMNLIDMGDDPNSIPANANVMKIESENENGEFKPGLLIDLGVTGEQDHKWEVTANCDFNCQLTAATQPTTVSLDVNGSSASSTIQNAREGKTYAVRYYLDTDVDREGEHYFLDMVESDPFTYAIPTTGSLAPSGDYYVTAVLVEKVVGDFNGDGETTEDEYSWVTVDTVTSSDPITYTNDKTPNAPTDVALNATGNETLTATWKAPTTGAAPSGYRVTLYYEDDNEWKQAGAPYSLNLADFNSTEMPAAKVENGVYTFRMAPTVGGWSYTSENVTPKTTEDHLPANTSYKAVVEAFVTENADGVAGGLSYYSAAAESRDVLLPAYTPKAITVTASNGQQITLNADNGYDTLTWNALPAVNETLFTIDGYDGTSFTVTVAPDPGTCEFTVDSNGNVTADASARVLIASSGRVKLTVTEDNDKTEYYLRLTLDDIAPIVTLDSENVAADPTTGKYTITGTTEPGLTVKLNTEPEATATAGVDGRFEIQGTLTQTNASEMTETAGFEALLGEVTAKDGAGNASDPAAVIVTAREQWTPPEDPTDPTDPGSSGGSKRANADKADKNENPFRDVSEDDWFYEDVLFAHEEGLLTGTAKRTFSPYANTTRAMMATVLWRMDGKPEAKADSRFTDVAGGQWYSDAVAWADENGIVKGYGTGAFGTNDPVTREQFAAMLYRYAQYSGRVIQTGNDLTDFKDAGKVSSWAQDAMLWAVHNGIVTGKPGKLLDPQGTATRAEIAAMLRRFVKNTVYTRDVK